jgi:maltose O-acetyltransferase
LSEVKHEWSADRKAGRWFGGIIDDAPVVIGARVLIGPNVQLVTAMHPLRVAERRTLQADVDTGSAAWRTIGEDTFINVNCVISPSDP